MRFPGFLPTRRLLWLLAGASPLFLIGTPAALAVDALLLGVALADALLAHRRRWLHVERHVPARLSLGAAAEVVLRIENRSLRSVRLEVTDDLPAGLHREGPERFAVEVPARGEAGIVYRVRAEARGELAAGAVHLRVRGPFGLVWHQHRSARSDVVRVQPGVPEVRRYRLLGLRHRLQEAGLRNVRQKGDGGSFESLRNYARGDDPRSIDWKATAKHGALMVRQFEAERSQNVLLAIDAGRLMTERIGDRERIDAALAAALLLADVASVHSDRVGLLVFSDRIEQCLPPARVSLSRMADALGRVRPRLVEPNYPAAFAILSRQFRRRSLVVLFSDVIDARASAALISHLTRSASRHLALVVALRNPELDAAAAAAPENEAAAYRRAAAEELLQARAHALATMQRAGALVADARPGDAIPVVVNRYLEVKEKGLL